MRSVFVHRIPFLWHPSSGELDLFVQTKVTVEIQAHGRNGRWEYGPEDVKVADVIAKSVIVKSGEQVIAETNVWDSITERLGQQLLRDAQDASDPNGNYSDIYLVCRDVIDDLEANQGDDK